MYMSISWAAIDIDQGCRSFYLQYLGELDPPQVEEPSFSNAART